jgi:hypothetical protein
MNIRDARASSGTPGSSTRETGATGEEDRAANETTSAPKGPKANEPNGWKNYGQNVPKLHATKEDGRKDTDRTATSNAPAVSNFR